MALPRAFSLQDASLLSGIEPLPLSSPTSPRHSFTDLSSPPPRLSSPSLRRTVSSDVTAQLYASLRRSQEVDEEQESEEPPKGSGRTDLLQGSAMTSEVEELAEELSRRLQEGLEASERKEPSLYISQMESLRCHLKTMLTLAGAGTSHEEASEKRREQQSDATSTLLSAAPGLDLSPPLSLVGLEGLFPRYSTLYSAAPPDLQLRDALEKETARRKHLERHIQNLQSEMLELQQRASVMLAADRRKDSMIQQLDQTLALVVGGWKQQEHQREESMRRLRQEKEEAEQVRSRDQENLTQVEQRLSEALESLDRQTDAKKEQQMELQRLVDEQSARASQLQAEREARERERRELESLQRRVEEQQRSWEEREQELQEECRRVQERGSGEVEKEKAISQQEMQKSQQLQMALAALQGDVLRLERELQTSHRERDTLQMELNLEKARNESEKVRLESEHKMRLEEVITERLSALHEESARHLCAVREQHRKQLLELTSQHESELCRQLSQFKSELQERERRHRDLVMDYELKLSRSEEQCLEMSRSLCRLENERTEMLSQLQDVMKSHWSQALRVLTAKVPHESSSLTIHHQQTETSDEPISQLRKGVYGEETRIRGRQGIVGAENQTEMISRHLKKDKETNEYVQKSNLQTMAGGSQHLEHSQGSRQVGSRKLTDSNGSDLINFSRIVDERSQSISRSSPEKDPNLRFLGDGAHMSIKTNTGNNTAVQADSGETQLSRSIGQLGSSPNTEDTTNLSNSGAFKTDDLQTIQELMASDTIRKYIACQYIREPYGQLMVEQRPNVFYPEKTNFNVIGFDQSKDTSGPSVRRSKTLLPIDSSIHRIEGIHQSLMGRSQQMSEKNVLNHTGNSQVRSSGVYAFTGAHNQSTDSSVLNQTKDSRHIISQLKESSHPGVDHSLLSMPAVPNLSPISKVAPQGRSHIFRIPSVHGEKPLSGHQPSYKVSDPEESFYPMQVEELSHSFSSHHGFFPLEPQPDGTTTGNVSTTFPQSSPEQPFHEEPNISMREAPSDWAGGDQATHNPVLQYYIRMLLDRTPGDPLNELDTDMTELSQSLQRGDHLLPRSDEEQRISKLPTNNTKKNPAKGPEAVKKEVLSNQRRPGPSKPLKRVSARAGRAAIWK